MKPRVEVNSFSNGKLKVVVRFFQASNFWIHEQGEEATWVPTFEELEMVDKTLKAINEFNILNSNK
jgi:stage V sporulation protein SpoVS